MPNLCRSLHQVRELEGFFAAKCVSSIVFRLASCKVKLTYGVALHWRVMWLLLRRHTLSVEFHCAPASIFLSVQQTLVHISRSVHIHSINACLEASFLIESKFLFHGAWFRLLLGGLSRILIPKAIVLIIFSHQIEVSIILSFANSSQSIEFVFFITGCRPSTNLLS